MITQQGPFYAKLQILPSSQRMVREWVELLRDPQAVQATGYLRTPNSNKWRLNPDLTPDEQAALRCGGATYGYCCLGKITERYLPTFWDLRDIGANTTNGSETLPPFLQEALNLSTAGSFMETSEDGTFRLGSLANLNDNGARFPAIADTIERIYDTTEANDGIFPVAEVDIGDLCATTRRFHYQQFRMYGLFRDRVGGTYNYYLGRSTPGDGLRLSASLFTSTEWLDTEHIAQRFHDVPEQERHGIRLDMSHDEVNERALWHLPSRTTRSHDVSIYGLWSDHRPGIITTV